jgi:nucleotide-binding universal stress UspA family protein
MNCLESMASLKRILVAIDFEPPSFAALDWAIDLASQVRVGVTVLHAWDIPIVGITDGTFIATPKLAAAITTAAQKGLADAVEPRQGRDVELTTLLRQGAPTEVIQQAADEVDAGLIVVGTHGRKGIAHALIGSIAERTIRTATRPVVIVRARA